MTKEELLRECAEVMGRPPVVKFYETYLQTDTQRNTVRTLEEGVKNGSISTYEALCIALVVGVQWNEKFEGTP